MAKLSSSGLRVILLLLALLKVIPIVQDRQGLRSVQSHHVPMTLAGRLGAVLERSLLKVLPRNSKGINNFTQCN